MMKSIIVLLASVSAVELTHHHHHHKDLLSSKEDKRIHSTRRLELVPTGLTLMTHMKDSMELKMRTSRPLMTQMLLMLQKISQESEMIMRLFLMPSSHQMDTMMGSSIRISKEITFREEASTIITDGPEDHKAYLS